jgi:L-aminopeptidase/D-esterase-like protein
MNRSLTAVHGVLAGHHTDAHHRTGVTAALFPAGARAGVWIPGSATGTRELGVLTAGALADRVHALVLAGGSAFGLAAADGVARVLAARGVGFATPHGVVPIVPAAILYDLHTATLRPDAEMGARAAEAAGSSPLAEGRVGAGAGARVGAGTGASAPGGFGSWAEALPGGDVVAVGVAVNAFGSIVDPSTGRVVAGAAPGGALAPGRPGEQTTLAIVATSAGLDREQCVVVGRMAAAGFARTTWPAFTPFDGDVIFVASTGAGRASPDAVARLGDAAARCVAEAVLRGVR